MLKIESGNLKSIDDLKSNTNEMLGVQNTLDTYMLLTDINEFI